MQIADHTFLVTGGSSGLGQGCVRRFVAAGARVVIADIEVEAGEQLASQLGDHVAFARTDVTSEVEVGAAIKLAFERFDGLQGVIHCAGVLVGERVLGREGPHSLDLFERVIRVNLVGTFNVARLVAAAMGEQEPADAGERGVIITVSSMAAFEGQIGQAAYSASKGAVASMTLPMARELARFGIRVVSIAPGIFETPMMQNAPAQVRDSLQEQTLFPPRFGSPDEFAALVQHVVENPMLNGAVLRLDGAVRMGPK